MQDRKDARQELGFRTVMVFKGAEPEEAGQNGSRTGGSRTGGCWTKWKQNRRKLDRMEAEPEEAGQNGSRTQGSWTEWKQNRRKLDRMDAEQEGCISCRAAGILD